MLFEDPIRPGRIYFFGGNITGNPNKSIMKKSQTVEGSPLYELEISWDENNRPT